MTWVTLVFAVLFQLLHDLSFYGCLIEIKNTFFPVPNKGPVFFFRDPNLSLTYNVKWNEFDNYHQVSENTEPQAFFFDFVMQKMLGGSSVQQLWNKASKISTAMCQIWSKMLVHIP